MNGRHGQNDPLVSPELHPALSTVHALTFCKNEMVSPLAAQGYHLIDQAV